MGDLSPREFYDRQLRVPGWGEAGQDTLGQSTVLVIGVGGLGCPALSALARSGVGRLLFCDPDSVEISNLPRQTLFNMADVGRSKVEAAQAALLAANPWIHLEPMPIRVDATNIRQLVEAADLVIDGTDTFAAKFLIHDACRSAAKPLVMASLYQWEAQVMAFPFHKPGPGCWRCLYPKAPEDGCVGVCAEVGVAGALAGLAGNFQALTALRILLDLEGPQACRTWILDAADWAPRQLKWRPNPDCECAQGPGNWAWLDALNQPTTARSEALWNEIALADRQIVVDVRELSEIEPEEWEFFEKSGSQVLHFPWTQWDQVRPDWSSKTTYLVVCAKGYRSLAATKTVAPGVKVMSLTGGVAGLKRRD